MEKTKIKPLSNLSHFPDYYAFSLSSQYDSNFKLEAARSYSKHCAKTGECDFLIKARRKANKDRAYNILPIKSKYNKCISFRLFNEISTTCEYSFKDD